MHTLRRCGPFKAYHAVSSGPCFKSRQADERLSHIEKGTWKYGRVTGAQSMLYVGARLIMRAKCWVALSTKNLQRVLILGRRKAWSTSVLSIAFA